MGAIVAVINKSGENAAEHAAKMLKILSHKGVEKFGLASAYSFKIEDSVEKLSNFNVNSPILIGYAFSKIIAADKPQPTMLEKAACAFEGRIYTNSTESSDAEFFAEKIRENHLREAESFVREADGGFAFVIAEKERLVAGRDSIGICPLYFGENERLFALASEKKALWKIGIADARSFPPGTLLVANKSSFRFARVKGLIRERTSNINMRDASETLKVLLQDSVEKMTAGLEDVAVAFSGGLDSSLIAFLAKRAGVNVHLIHVSLKNQPETAHAVKVAEDLKLPINVYTYTVEDVKETLPKVLWLVEEPDPIKVSLGVPMCWAAEKTAELGVKVLFTGQGADELFGGYKRYLTAHATHGQKAVEEMLFNDVLSVHEASIEKDYKICNFHNVELRLPYLTYKIAEFAVNLPLKFKITLSRGDMRKLVLRTVAKKLGLPKAVVERPKRAMQYATGVDKTIRKLAKKENLSIKEYLARTFQNIFEKMVKDD
ncbi:MAG: asparagine synthetase B family protein [Candidatus Bathyarchaeales archaeon]